VGKSNAFKFLDDDLNQRLLALLRKDKIKHEVGNDGIIRYSPDEEDVIENNFIFSIRDQVFPSWQVLTCPRDWAERYKEYMSRHRIPFHESDSLVRQILQVIQSQNRRAFVVEQPLYWTGDHDLAVALDRDHLPDRVPGYQLRSELYPAVVEAAVQSTD